MKNWVALIIFLLPLFACKEQTGKKQNENQQNSVEQKADSNYSPPDFNPKYTNRNAPTIYIDEAHFNFHTSEGRYKPFADLLTKDGYTVASFNEKFTNESLVDVEILVIANAMFEASNLQLPTASAFSNHEIKVVNDWVENGGALFLIADHMPAAGAAAKLALAFNFNFINGYLYNTKTFADVDLFTKKEGTLTVHSLTEGIDSIATFTGQAFVIPPAAQSLLNVGEDFMIYLSSEIGKISGSKTPKFYAQGLSQAAIIKWGRGRIAIFGEAGMFTAQIGKDNFKMGMNNEKASQNFLLLLNIVHWLDETLPESGNDNQ